MLKVRHCLACVFTDKNEKKIFLIYREIQSGAVAKSFLIYEEMQKKFSIYEEVVSHIWLCNCSTPYIWGKLDFLFYQCSVRWAGLSAKINHHSWCFWLRNWEFPSKTSPSYTLGHLKGAGRVEEGGWEPGEGLRLTEWEIFGFISHAAIFC